MGLIGMKMGSGEGSTMRNLIVRTVHLISKSRRLRWAGHVARIEESRSAFKILTGKPTDTDVWGGLNVDGRTILERTLKRDVSMRGIMLIRFRIRNYWRVLVNTALNLRAS